MEALYNELSEDLWPMLRDLEQAEAALDNTERSSRADTNDLKALEADVSELRAAARKRLRTYESDVLALLTPTQRTRYKNAVKDGFCPESFRPTRGYGRGQGRGYGRGYGRGR